MKRVILHALVLFLSSITPVLAKSYRIENLTVDARVLPSGALEVQESIRYHFRGSYSFAFREIPLKTGERIHNIRVSEGGEPYQEGQEEAPGFFGVSSEEDQVKITWFYRAREEKRTFTLSYTVLGVVHRYPDVGELYYQFVGEGWDHAIDQVSVRVQLTDAVPVASVRAWAHGPLHGSVTLPGDGSVRFEVSPLPARTFWEGRILFDPAALEAVPLFSPEPARDRILAEEASWAEEANRRREQAARDAARREELFATLFPFAILIPLIGIAVWLFLYLKHGRPYPQRRAYVPGEVPSSHEPAVVSHLLHRSVGGPALVATLIDLARRGHLTIREEVRETRGWLGTKRKTDYHFDLTSLSRDGLKDFERSLLDFILEQAGNGSGFWMSDFKKAASRKRSMFIKWFRQWGKSVEALGREEGFFESYQLKVLLTNILVGVAVTAVGVVITVLTQSPLGVPAIVIGVVQAILSVLLSRRSVAGEQLYRAWKGYKAHIKSMTRLVGPVSLTSREWGNYLVASVIFGLHQKLGKVLEVSVGRDDDALIPWFYMSSTGGEGSGFGGLGTGISSMVTAMSSTMSSASGMGGGASAGGGGAG